MDQVWGDFRAEIIANHQLFGMDFFVQTTPINHQNRTRYLLVAFLSDYLGTLFPASENDSHALQRQLEIKSTAAYITHELLENSKKFNNEEFNYPIKFKICLVGQTLIFVASNSVTKKGLHNFQVFMEELSNSDSQELYFSQLEKGAEENSYESRLGLLSMITDYQAKLGWKVETVKNNPDMITVTTMVQLNV